MGTIITIGLLLASPSLLDTPGYGNGYCGGMMAGFGWFGFAFWFLFAALVLLALYYLLKQGTQAEKQESALEAAKMRYAKGEITRQELEEIRKEINKPIN